ncbi:hypothetical protein C5E45_26485 [Nocardia nova]|uniref:Type I restriction modification DNA specificity domain-containing protein n=1 Tax=Nocardia nova TaxID=37330 RepID=A0A2S6AJ04_9NOCA|nr:restriction endonuclease subunit S [Nocardia nova]PPJ35219.1 hypothetical protein C5E45_26485 [Nocardia nova]
MNSSYPESWEVVSLDSICRPKQWATINVGELTEDGFPVYGANGKIGYYSSYNHTQPTVLITCRGASCGAINISEPNSYVTGNAMALDDMNTSRVDLNYLARTLARRGYLRKAITGSAQPQITRETLRSVSVPLPPLAEQRRIAEVLDRVDALREKRRKSIAFLDELAQSIFVDMFGDGATEFGDWEMRPLASVAAAINDCPHSTPKWTDLGVVCLRTSNLAKGRWNWRETRYVAEESYVERSKRGEIVAGDIILSREGTVGVAAISDGTRMCMGQRLVQVRSNVELVTPEYLLHYLLSVLEPEKISKYMIGSTAQHLNVKDLRALRVPLPPIALQQDFARRISSVEGMRTDSVTHLNELDALFASIQSRAFRGELWQDELKDL